MLFIFKYVFKFKLIYSIKTLSDINVILKLQFKIIDGLKQTPQNVRDREGKLDENTKTIVCSCLSIAFSFQSA